MVIFIIGVLKLRIKYLEFEILVLMGIFLMIDFWSLLLNKFFKLIGFVFLFVFVII